MSFATFRLTVVLGLVAGLGLPDRAQAQNQQFRPAPNPDDTTGLQTQGIARPSLGSPGFSYVPEPAPPSPFPSYGGYGGYYPGRVGGALQGVASVTTANADAVNTLQQARITDQQAEQSKISTRRQLFDELRYEQANTPTYEDRREMDRQNALRRARNNPPNTEIWAGISLNALASHLEKVQRDTGLRGPYVPLGPDVLKHINVTDGTVRVGAGLFRDGAKLTWPFDLTDERFEQDRGNIDRLSAKAIDQLKTNGSVEPGTLRDLLSAAKALQAHIDGAIADMTPSQYTRSARYANQLIESVRTLTQPDASKFFNGSLQAKGNNVADFIANLNNSGLTIAPATSDDETAYNVLYRMLLDYDASLTRITTR
jgi:hypothetical protein